MSPAGHCRADCTFREVREKVCQPGALLTHLPIAEQCGVATSWGSPKEGLPPHYFSHPTIPSASPRQRGSPPRPARLLPGAQGRAALSDRKGNSSLWKAECCPAPAPPREKRKSRAAV